MKVQIITGNSEMLGGTNVTVSHFSSPTSPDDFDVNIIDLSFPEIWKNRSGVEGKLDIDNDLQSLARMVNDSIKTKIVYVYPQDNQYWYDFFGGKYNKKMKIKDLITSRDYRLEYKDCFPKNAGYLDVIFEPTKTKINGKEFVADFRFASDYKTVITKSEISNKPTSIRIEKGIVFTTLNICSSIETIMTFVEEVFAENSLSDIPVWVREFEFNNDKDLKVTIESSKKQISDLQRIIEESEKELNSNNRYKTILVNNGASLVEVVFDILERLLDCDLSGFVDQSREDFRIEKEKVTFIGEIKGINTNVKNGNISQLDVHYQNYLDELEDKQQVKTVKAILIINPFKSRRIDERDPINENQIELAKRNGSLIIETITLLKMFEMYLNDKLSSERCAEVLLIKNGLLSIDDFVE